MPGVTSRKLRPAFAAQRARFLRRAHNAVQPAVRRELAPGAPPLHPGSPRCRLRADRLPSWLVSTVTAMRRGRSCRLAQGFPRRRHHRTPAQRMHVQHPDAECCGRLARLRHGVGNVVELQIEEHGESASHRALRPETGPAAVNSSLPTFSRHSCGRQTRRASASAPGGVGEIQATMIFGSLTSGLVSMWSVLASVTPQAPALRCGGADRSPSRGRPGSANRTAAP